MAKNNRTLFPLSGTLAGLTFVDSATYGPHVRRPRGTVKPAHVNKTLHQNANRAPKITALGAPLLQCFKEMGGSFVQRGLWQVMMKRMFGAQSTSVLALLQSLEGLELNKNYPLDKLLVAAPEIKLSAKIGSLNVQLSGLGKVKFPRGVKVDSCRFELFVTWIDSKGGRFEGDVQTTGWLLKDHETSKYNFKFTKENWAKYMMLVIRLQAGVKGEVDAALQTGGMRVMQVLEL